MEFKMHEGECTLICNIAEFELIINGLTRIDAKVNGKRVYDSVYEAMKDFEHKLLSELEKRIMNKYCCHCTVQMFDYGFMAGTTSRPTIIVEAKDKNEAIGKARDKFIKEYTDNTVEVKSFTVVVINQI